MSPADRRIAPRYVRLSGEIADQAVLDSLKARFPDAAIGHAYASTEAGVGFEVTDGLEGFPASFIGGARPGGNAGGGWRAADPLAAHRQPLMSAARDTLMKDGWVDTGDMVELRGERYYFAGRRGGIINVGGLKINPEEVEAVINRHPGVRAVAGLGPQEARSPAPSWWPKWCWLDAANDNASFKRDHCWTAVPQETARLQGAGHAALCAEAGTDARAESWSRHA